MTNCRVGRSPQERTASMASAQGYYRHPTIHGDNIVFVSEDDLWSVPADGGVPRRLTATPGAVHVPVALPGRKAGRLQRPGRGPARDLLHGRGGRPAPAPDLARHHQLRRRLDAQRPLGHLLQRLAPPLPPRADAARRAGRRRLSGLPRPRTGPRHLLATRRPRRGPRPQLGRSRSLEALQRRHRGHHLDRPAGQRRVRAAAEARRKPRQSDVDRRTDLVPLRPRGIRQPLLLHPHRPRSPPAHAPRGLLRSLPGHRRSAHRLPRRRRPLRLRPPEATKLARSRSAWPARARNGRASSSPQPAGSRGSPCTRTGTRSPRCTAAACTAWGSGKEPRPSRQPGRRPLPARLLAARRPADRRRDRRGRRGEPGAPRRGWHGGAEGRAREGQARRPGRRGRGSGGGAPRVRHRQAYRPAISAGSSIWRRRPTDPTGSRSQTSARS